MDPHTLTLIERIFAIVYAALGLSLILHANRWVRVYTPAWNDPNFALRLGSIPLVIGVIIVVLHPAWTADTGSIVTAIGWLALFKGLVCVWRPEWMEAVAGRIRPTAGMFRLRGGIVCILAALVAWRSFAPGDASP
ncbi:MAG: hypothetical protein JNK58_12570 [Phycisphaerae bacterium]|nr:hypothetical protein [Phycisphaerae bacterium]